MDEESEMAKSSQAWVEVATMLEYLTAGDEYIAQSTRPKVLERTWFAWSIDWHGRFLLTRLPLEAVQNARYLGAALQGEAANAHKPAGLGVWCPGLGPLILTAYCPPSWPVVPNGVEKRRRVKVTMPVDDDFKAWVESGLPHGIVSAD